jgi:hypothetical protein
MRSSTSRRSQKPGPPSCAYGTPSRCSAFFTGSVCDHVGTSTAISSSLGARQPGRVPRKRVDELLDAPRDGLRFELADLVRGLARDEDQLDARLSVACGFGDEGVAGAVVDALAVRGEPRAEQRFGGGVDRVEHGVDRAVALDELLRDASCVHEVALGLEKHSDVGAAKGVDRLLGVADEQAGRRARARSLRGRAAGARRPCARAGGTAGRAAVGWCPETRRRGRRRSGASTRGACGGSSRMASRRRRSRSAKSRTCLRFLAARNRARASTSTPLAARPSHAECTASAASCSDSITARAARASVSIERVRFFDGNGVARNRATHARARRGSSTTPSSERGLGELEQPRGPVLVRERGRAFARAGEALDRVRGDEGLRRRRVEHGAVEHFVVADARFVERVDHRDEADDDAAVALRGRVRRRRP